LQQSSALSAFDLVRWLIIEGALGWKPLESGSFLETNETCSWIKCADILIMMKSTYSILNSSKSNNK
jgi:hypothetical protein